MSHSDQNDSSERQPEQGLRSVQETVDEANQAIEASRAQIARSRALGRSEAELARKIDRISEGNGASAGQDGSS
jgi:hypothetical protein